MKKRILSLMLAAAMLITFIPVIASAGMDISIGQYVQMGTYYGEPILWRCVAKDENGPLMLSDKILCIKAFDAKGGANTATGSHSRSSGRQSYGSNYWADSNMRSWLNSTASAGNVQWLCGNPPIKDKLWNGYNAYDREAGFLSNFTQPERDAMKEVRQKSLLSYPEYENGIATTGTERYTYNSSIAGVVANYDTAYAEYVTDKMFCMDVKQVNAVYNNSDILGESYYIGKPTAQCAENSEYKDSSLATGKKWHYWLRSPYSGHSSTVRVVCSDGVVSNYNASYHVVGVRPAFYLNPSSSIQSGSGTESAPYTIVGGGGGGTQGNTNSTSDGAPIITSAKLTHGGKTYDMFTQAVTIEKDSDVKASIEAEVNANGNKNVKVYVTQGIGNAIDITGVSKDITPGKDFSAGKTIYVMAVDEKTGKSTSKAIKLKVTSSVSGSLGAASGVEGLNFKLGKDVGFTIPDSVPVFGGTDIKWSFDFIPITVAYDKEDDNKLNVVIGGNVVSEEYEKNGVKRKYFKNLDFKKYKKDISHAARTQKHDLRDLRKYFDNDKGKKKNMNLFGGAVSGSGKGGAGGDIDFMGYAEMKYIDGQWKFVEGVVKLDAEIKYTYEGQVFIWVVPCYYEFGGGVGAGFEGKMINLNPDGFTPQFEGYLSAKILAEIGGGVGIAGVATAGASGEGSLNIKTALARKYIKSWGEGSASFNVKLFGKTVAEKEFARGDFLIYETGNNKGLIKDNAVSLQSDDEGIYNIDVNQVYENESRAYAGNPTEWVGDELQTRLMSADYTNKDLHKLADNIYTESAPQICEVDGEKIMVMQWDNASRADADRTMLVYSVYDEAGKTWSSPKAVDDDGTADFYPCFKDGYLVWQNEKTTLADDMTLTDIAKLGEICVSEWNGNGFDTPVALTDNNTLDTQPSVAKTSNGASVAWTTNTENDIMGITGKNAIMQSDFDGTNWSNPTEIKSNLNSITNITAGIVNDIFRVAYVTDDDNNLNTINDRDIRIIGGGSETQLTNNDVLDSNPVFADDKIYYYRDGNIVYSDIDGTNESKVFDEAKQGLTDTFVVDSNGNGDIAVWWTKAVGGGAEVYASLYKDNEWSNEIKVTEVGNRAKYPSGIINNDGSMVVAFNNGIEEENKIIKTDLYTISVNPSYDLELTDAYFDESTMTARAVVKNNGELSADSYTVALEDNNQTITEPLKAGESKEIEISYNKPNNLSARTIMLSVALANGEEYNTDNNSAEFVIGHADIEVANVAANENETAITAEVSNIGYDNAQNVKVELRDGDANGAVIEEKTINLNVGAKESVEFAIDKSVMRFFDASKQLYVTAQISGDEVSLGNNDGYVIIQSKSGAADYETEVLGCNEVDGKFVINSVARNNTGKSISCVMYSAVYSSDGTLKSCGKVNADIAAENDTGVDITVPCTIEKGDTVKTFMWTDKMTPLAPCGELAVE